MNNAVLTWCRGFVIAVKCNSAFWLQHADAILAGHPVEEVELTTNFTIRFGPTHRKETPGPYGHICLYASWDAQAEGDKEIQFHRQASVKKDREAEELYVRREFEKQIAQDRTAQGFVAARWPGIKFTMPSTPQERPLGYHTLTGRINSGDTPAYAQLFHDTPT